MARKIGIELEINGVKESINTIGQLEDSIESLTEELKSVEIGSEEFNKLTNELNTARSQLKTFEATFEGLDPQQKTQAYLAFGESVVSGILLAQEALRTFGIENEEVNNAVEASTQAINLALQARIVIEGVLEARVLATTIAQNALNTSFVAGNVALRTLFTTIIANPVGALIAAIGLLVTAFIALSDSSDEATDSMEKNETQQKALELQSKRLRRELDALNKSTDDYIKSVENFDLSTATSEAARLEEELNNLKETTEEVRDLNFAEIARQIGFEGANIEDFNLNLEEQKRVLDEVIEAQNRYELALRASGDQDNENTKALVRNVAVLEEVANQLEESIERQEGSTEALEKQLEAVRDRIKEIKDEASTRELNRFTDSLSDAADEVERLNRKLLDFGDTPTPDVIKDLEDLLALQIQLNEITDESRKGLGDVFNDYIDNITTALKTNDEFGKSYEQTRKDLTQAFRTGKVDEFQAAIDKVYETYFDENSNFNDEQRRTIAQLLSSYQVAFQQLQQFGIDSSEEFDSIVSPLLNELGDKLRLEGKIRFDRAEAEKEGEEAGKAVDEGFMSRMEKYTRDTGKIKLSTIVDTSELQKALTAFDLYENQIDEVIFNELSLNDVIKNSEEFYKVRNDLIKNFTDEFLKSADLQKLQEEDSAAAQEKALERATEAADGIIEIITNTAIAEDAIRGVYNEVEDLQIQVRDFATNSDTFLGLILQNFDEVSKQFDLIDLINPDGALEENLESNFEAISSFFESIGVESFDVLFDTETKKIDLIKLFLQKRRELEQENLKNSEKDNENYIQRIQELYGGVLDSLNDLSLSLGEVSQLQIERIERNTQQTLNNIVGDTEEAEQLRTEIQEQSTEKIIEIERRARLRELQFTKIQAIADLAQALIKALALPPPFNAIQSTIVGTAGSIQIATIQGQIDDIKSSQGFAEGGYVSGEGTSTSDSIPAMLSNGEFVVNAKATEKFLPLLKMINENQIQNFNNGGYVLNDTMMSSTNIQNIFDDSRIIEELRRNRNEPIRAYVFEKDITEAQEIDKRLKELSKL